jgi:hypothetical protein
MGNAVTPHDWTRQNVKVLGSSSRFCSLLLLSGGSRVPLEQAVLLAIFAAYMTSGLVQVSFQVAATGPLHTFEPYYVRIIPNWTQILADYTTAKNDEDWLKFVAWCGRTELPGAWYSVLRNDKDGVLIYRGSELGFSTTFNWSYEVKKREWLGARKAETSPEGFPDSMDFLVKQKFDVIQLGLSVRSDWWKTSSRHCPDPVETHEEHMFGTVQVVLAQLPLREFDLYWNEVDYKIKNVDKTWESVRENRKKYGWEEMEKYRDVPSSLQPITIKNKYFEVQHHSIE